MNYFVSKTKRGLRTYHYCVIKDSISEYSKEFFEENDIEYLRLSVRGTGWKVEDLSKLREFPFLRGIDIITVGQTIDLSPLSELIDLETLHVDCVPKKNFDLSVFKNLNDLIVECYSPKIVGIEDLLNLRYLNIDKYRSTNLQFINSLRLEQLHVISRSVQSLEGIERLSHLKELELHGCTQLSDISQLSYNEELTHLLLSSCNKLGRIDHLPASLKSLFIENCKAIENCKFVHSLNNLESFFFTGESSFIDGDLSPIANLEGLKRLFVRNRRHYNKRFND